MSSYFHSASQSCPILSANCRYNLRLFRLFRGDSSGMDKSSSAKCLLYSDVVKGEPSPTGRGRRSRDEKGNQGVGDIRFTNKSFTPFFYSFLFFNYFTFSLFFYTFFTHDIYPHPHPRPTPTTHDLYPRPTTHDPRPTTHDPRHLATLDLARAKSEALFNIYSFLEENIKSSNTKDKVKTTRTVKNNNNNRSN